MDEHPVDVVIEEIESGDTTSCELRNCRKFPTKSKKFADALSKNTSITSLTLANWQIGSIGGKHLSVVLRKNQTLVYMNLETLNIGPEGGDSIAAALRKNSTLREFRSKGTKFSSSGIASIAHGLTENSSLEVLQLAYHSIDATSCQRLAIALKKNKLLRFLSLAVGRFDLAAAESLNEALATNRSLETLIFKGFRMFISAETGTFLNLGKNKSLKTLELSSSTLHRRSYAALAAGLRQNRTLVSLSLRNSHLRNEDLSILCVGFRKNRHLEFIDLSYNEFETGALTRLSDSLVFNKSLRTLDLAGSVELSQEVKVLWANFIDRSETVVELRLLERSFASPSPFDLIEAALNRNRDATRQAFRKAIQGKVHVPWQRSKLMVVGEGGVGKTALVRSLLNKVFDAKWKSTIGIQLTETKTFSTGGWKEVSQGRFATEVANRVIAGQVASSKAKNKARSKSQKIGKKLRRGSKGAEVEEDSDEGSESSTTGDEEEVVDDELDEEDSQEDSSLQEEKEDEEQDESEETVKGKSALKQLVEEVYEYNEALFVETQKETGSIRISIWDYGGQMVFQSLHHLFLTRYGVYLLVFSLKELRASPQISMGYIKHWVDSIKLHAPEAPVLFIGTFVESVKRRHVDRAKEILADGLGSEMFSLEAFHAVSNKRGTGIQALREAIENLTRSLDYVYTQVSVQWMKALDMLLSASEEESSNPQNGPTQAWVRREAFARQVVNRRLGSHAEVEDMLCLFHEFGAVLYFNTSESLKDLVICQPQWVIDAISEVIRDKDIHGLDMADLTKRGLDIDARRLLEEGLASRDLLECLWEQDQADYLISLMHRLLLMSTWRFSKTEALFLVPSMTSEEDYAGEQAEAFVDGFSSRFLFELLPNGVFERIVCLCVSLSHSAAMSTTKEITEPVVRRNSAIVWLSEDCRLAMRIENSREELQFWVNKRQHLRSTLDSLQAMLHKVKREFAGNRLTWTLLVQCEEEWIEEEKARSEEIGPWFSDEDVEEQGEHNENALTLQPFFDIFT